VYAVAAACALNTLFLILIITGHGFVDIFSIPISVKSLVRNFQILLIGLAVLLIISPRARSFAAQWAGSIAGLAVLLTVATFVMSLGPEIKTMGRSLRGTAPYAFFYWHVPGFDGLRVPARYGMLTMVFLSIAAGFGAAEVERRFRPSAAWGGIVVILLGLFGVVESIAAPIVVNGTGPEADYATPPSHMTTGDQAPDFRWASGRTSFGMFSTPPSTGILLSTDTAAHFRSATMSGLRCCGSPKMNPRRRGVP
jgi:hypothetical protein